MPPRPPITHFLCLPLITPTTRPQWAASLARFTAETTSPSTPPSLSLPPKAIRPAGAIHLTIGIMSLPTPERVAAALEYLQHLDVSSILRSIDARAPNTMRHVKFKGLRAMQAPEKTSSLYVAPAADAEAVLVPFCEMVKEKFVAADFMLAEGIERRVKMHATVVNTIYAREKGGGKRRWGRGSRKIDARGVLREWGEMEWAVGEVGRVAVCEMGVREVVLEGGEGLGWAYREVGGVDLFGGEGEEGEEGDGR